MGQMMTIAEVAERLKVSDDVIRKLIKRRELAASKVVGQWRIEEQALRDYLTASSNQQPQAVAQPR